MSGPAGRALEVSVSVAAAVAEVKYPRSRTPIVCACRPRRKRQRVGGKGVEGEERGGKGAARLGRSDG